MATQYDRSEKDKKYFIDNSIYNCPYCKRRHVSYVVTEYIEYDRTYTSKSYIYFVRCNDCNKISFHLSNYKLLKHQYGKYDEYRFAETPTQITTIYTDAGKYKDEQSIIKDTNDKVLEYDELFFYHLPTSFFTIDSRIPNAIREPLSEAENCLDNNFLTGASGCLRKVIYKLLKNESIPEAEGAKLINQDKRVDLLKDKYKTIDSALFDELKAIHILTSQELHENDWVDFDSNKLRFLIEVMKEILMELYVYPDEVKKRRQHLSHLKTNSDSSTSKGK